MENNKIQFRTIRGMHDELVKRSLDRANLSETARRDLHRYYTLLSDTYDRFVQNNTADVVLAIFEACKEMELPEDKVSHAAAYLRIWVAKAGERQAFKTYDVDADTVKACVTKLTSSEALSLIDAAAVWWRMSPEERKAQMRIAHNAGTLPPHIGPLGPF